jgi:hypothetical protein
MTAKNLLCPVTKHKINLKFPERFNPVDADDPPDLEETDDSCGGYVPVDQLFGELLAPTFRESEEDREERMFADDGIFPPNRLHAVGTLLELFRDSDNTPVEVDEPLSMPFDNVALPLVRAKKFKKNGDGECSHDLVRARESNCRKRKKDFSERGSRTIRGGNVYTEEVPGAFGLSIVSIVAEPRILR